MPPGTLGELGPAVELLAGLLGDRDGIAAQNPALCLFVADHGIAEAGTTADLPGLSSRLLAELESGTGTIAQLARASGVHATGVAAGPRSRRFDSQDALAADEVAEALQLGRDTASRRIDDGSELLMGSAAGVGVDVCAAAIGSVLTGIEPVDAAGRGSGVSDAGWMRRVAAVRDARSRLTTRDAAGMLQAAGGADLCALTGFVLEAGLRGFPVLVDDTTGLVAAALAHRFAPGVERWVLVAAAPRGLLARRLLDLLAITPLTSLDLGPGPALPALVAWPLLRGAALAVEHAHSAPEDRAEDALAEWDPDLL